MSILLLLNKARVAQGGCRLQDELLRGVDPLAGEKTVTGIGGEQTVGEPVFRRAQLGGAGQGALGGDEGGAAIPGKGAHRLLIVGGGGEDGIEILLRGRARQQEGLDHDGLHVGESLLESLKQGKIAVAVLLQRGGIAAVGGEDILHADADGDDIGICGQDQLVKAIKHIRDAKTLFGHDGEAEPSIVVGGGHQSTDEEGIARRIHGGGGAVADKENGRHGLLLLFQK